MSQPMTTIAKTSGLSRHRGNARAMPLWPWLLIAGMVCLIVTVLKLGTDSPAMTQPTATTVPETPAANQSAQPVTAATSLSAMPVAAVASADRSTQTASRTTPMREVPAEQVIHPGDDSAFLKDGDPADTEPDAASN